MDTMQVGGLEKTIQGIQSCVCLEGNTTKIRRRLSKLAIRHTSADLLVKSKALPLALNFTPQLRPSSVIYLALHRSFLSAGLCPAWHTESLAAHEQRAHPCCLCTYEAMNGALARHCENCAAEAVLKGKHNILNGSAGAFKKKHNCSKWAFNSKLGITLVIKH